MLNFLGLFFFYHLQVHLLIISACSNLLVFQLQHVEMEMGTPALSLGKGHFASKSVNSPRACEGGGEARIACLQSQNVDALQNLVLNNALATGFWDLPGEGISPGHWRGFCGILPLETCLCSNVYAQC